MSEQNDTTEVEYRELSNYPGYRVGSDGSAWSRWGKGCWGVMRDSWQRLKLHTNPKTGYLSIAPRVEGGRQKTIHLHKLVLEAFVGPCPEGMECRHLDGNRSNARLSNLAWGTPIENAADKTAHGRQIRGTQVCFSKLTDQQVSEIRSLVASGKHRQVDIAKRYGVIPKTIRNIVRRKCWNHVA